VRPIQASTLIGSFLAAVGGAGFAFMLMFGAVPRALKGSA